MEGQGNIAFLRAMGLGDTTEPGTTAGYSITWKSAGAYTGMVIKKDPGAPFIWIAYGSLILGLVLTFYFHAAAFGVAWPMGGSSWRCWPTATSTRSESSEGCWTSSRPDSVTVPNVECNPRRVRGRG